MEEFIKVFYQQPEHKAYLEKLYKLGPEAQGRLEHLYLMSHCPEYRQEIRLEEMEAQLQPALYHENAPEPSQDGQERALPLVEVAKYQTIDRLTAEVRRLEGKLNNHINPKEKEKAQKRVATKGKPVGIEL